MPRAPTGLPALGELDAKTAARLVGAASDIALVLDEQGTIVEGYLPRAYRRNKYEGIVEGYIIETGIGFVMSVDYDKIIEMFKRRKLNNSFEKEFKSSELPVKKSETPPLNDSNNKQRPLIYNEKKDEDEY